MTTQRHLAAAWQEFWFQQVPPELYALLRIVFGAIGLVGVLSMTPVSMFWSLDGLAPVPGSGLGLRSMLSDLGLSAVSGWLAFTALLASFVAMTVGWHSRIAVLLCFVGSVLQVRWNVLPLSSAHQALVAFLFCLIWADTGRVWSLDQWRADPSTSRQSRMVAIWPLRLLRFQIAMIYLGSGLSKLLEPVWRDGSAVYWAISSNVFHRFPFPVPAQLDGLLVAATYVTLFWELAFPLLILNRWGRKLALALGVMLHGGMWLSLELGPFSWVMLASYLAFLDPAERLSRVGRLLHAGERPSQRGGNPARGAAIP